jgi:short-subunit dehydrogenase
MAERARAADVAGTTVVITGAAAGLGAELAAALAARGALLLLVDIDAAGLQQRRDELGCEVLVADVSDEAGRGLIVARSGDLGWGPDVLVNNAGVEKASRFDELDAAEVRRALEVNLLGAVLLTHALLPGMRRRRRGHVVTMASMAGIKPVPYNAMYNSAKAALVVFSMSLSKELRGTGVHATVVCPSAVSDVGMWARTRRGRSANRLVDSSTVGPGEVVEAVLRALAERPSRVLVASHVVRIGALLSAMSPWVDRATDRLSGIGEVYRQRIATDRENRL